jgi:hypothetical protein
MGGCGGVFGAAITRCRYLSPRAVKQVLGDAFFAGVKTGAGQVA